MPGRVLVVDDQPINIRLLQAKLGAEYFDVLAAADGPRALELAAAERPDIVVVDLMMPGMDGVEVCRRLKTNPATAHVPVLVVTALDDPLVRLRGLEAGADDFLARPVNDRALIARLRALLRLKTTEDELRLRLATGRELGILGDAEEPAAETRCRILVVDEDAADRALISEAATGSHDVQDAVSAETAVPLLSSGAFDLALVSLAAGGFDGLRLCSLVRTNPATRQHALIALVEEGGTDRLIKGFELGINDYLVKPLDGAEVRARVRNQLRRAHSLRRLRQDYERCAAAAATDPLTGLFGRRYLSCHLPRLLAEAAAPGLSLFMLDIDRFKSINDRYGHLAGDAVLRQVARRIEGIVRPTDLACRWGGEEFVVVMPGIGGEDAQAIADRLCVAVAAHPFRVAINARTLAVPVTLSIGIAESRAGDTVEGLVGRADAALYAAKAEGRNRARRAPAA